MDELVGRFVDILDESVVGYMGTSLFPDMFLRVFVRSISGKMDDLDVAVLFDEFSHC